MKERKVKQGCGVGCRFQCNNKFNNDDRNEIFHSYWRLGEASRHRQFLFKFLTKIQKGRGKTKQSQDVKTPTNISCQT